MLALKSLICLVEKHPSYAKTHSMKIRFFDHWIRLDESKRQEVVGDARLLPIIRAEIEALGCPKDAKTLEALNEDFLKANPSSIENVQEYIKVRQRFFGDKDASKFETLAVTALTGDSQKAGKVYRAADLHRRLVKAGAKGNTFKTKAREQYKHSTYFQEELK